MTKMGQIVVKKMTFWEFLDKKFNKKDTSQQKAAAEESAAVRGLKKQIDILQEINDDQAQHIKNLTKQVAIADKRNMEEKLIDGAISIFTGNQNTPLDGTNAKQQNVKSTEGGNSPPNNQMLESGLSWSDEEIDEVVANIPQDQLLTVIQTPNSLLRSKLKSMYGVEVSNETINKAKEKARQRA
jgi:hypothetical protein